MPRRSVVAGLTVLALNLALAGCDLGPVFSRPDPGPPAEFRASPATAQAAWPAPDWWRGFGSPELDLLITAARTANPDLAVAAARIRQADAQARIAGAALLPDAGFSGGASWRQTSITARGQQIQSDVRAYNAGLNIGYEIDFWGKNRATADAAQAAALATRFDQQTVAITVTASAAQTWFAALAARDRLDVANRNLADAQQTLRVIRGRMEAGTANALDVAQQETLVATQRARIPDLRNQMEQQIIALGILIGQPPEAVTVQPGTLTRLRRPAVAPGLPSELLTRRPDVAAAEARLAAANANIRAARAAFFPSIQLTGAAGLQSVALSSLLGPGALVASLAAGITQPIFDGGTLRGRLELSKAQQDELLALYRKTILEALTDTDAALTALRFHAEQERLQRDAVARAQRAADIARAQLAAGTADLTAVLQAQLAVYSAQDILALARQAYFQDLIALFKALGGGWTNNDSLPPAPEPDRVENGFALPVGRNVQ